MNEGSRQSSSLAPFALIAAVIAISFAAIFFRKAQPTHPLVSAGIRLAIAAILLLPWTLKELINGKLKGRLPKYAIGAGVLYGIHFGAWVTSLTLTTVAASVTLVTTTPLLLAIVGTITGRDRPGKEIWASLGLVFIGLILIGGSDFGQGFDALAGDAFAVLGAIAMAGYLTVGRKLGDAMRLGAFSGIATATGAFCLLGTAAILQIPIKAASWEAFGYLFLAAAVPQLIGHNLLTWTLRHVKPAVVGMAVVGEPVGSTILGILWLGEMAGTAVLIGCGITLFAVILSFYKGAVRTERRA